MAVNARKPFAPVAAPILQAHSTHLLCFFCVFSPQRTSVRSLHTADAGTRTSTRISAANRRQNHKNFAAVGKERVWVSGSPGAQTTSIPVLRRLVSSRLARKSSEEDRVRGSKA